MLSRVFLVASISALVFTGCGGASDDALTTLAPTQATDFVVVDASTTTTTTTTVAAQFTAADPSLPASGTIPPSTTAATVTGASTYTIAAGDSMASIARKHGLTIDQLIAINGWTDGTSHLLLPGVTIKVSGSASSGTTASPTTAAGGNSGAGCTYTIKPDDAPWSVAQKFGITVNELRAANSSSVMDTFLAGSTLNIPANGNC